MRTIAVVAQKGGSLKTTSVINIAACLARRGRKVLVIDTDTQANASYVLLRGRPPRRPTLAEVLTGDATADEAVVATETPGVWLVPAEPALADVAVALAAEVGRERRLRAAMAASDADFDVCLIDTGPTRSLVTTNVLNYAGEILVPVGPGLFGVLGLGRLQADVDLVRRFLENRALRIAGVVLVTLERNNVCKEFETQVRAACGDLVFTTTVPRSVRFEEANARCLSIFDHAPRSSGARAYEALTLEVLSRGDGQQQQQEDRADPARRDLSAHHDAAETETETDAA